jgi:APA family basic amino acid/polyamine antiporter
MLGTGVFVSIIFAIQLTGPNVLWALLLAAAVATCNALNSAQLAAAHPVSGGTYEYGYRLVSPHVGFTAGWMFLCAKTASAAAAALAFSGYFLALLGSNSKVWLLFVAVIVVAAFTALICTGLRRTITANLIIVSATILSLIAFIIGGALTAFQPGGSLSATEGFSLVPIQFAGQTVANPSTNFLLATALLFVSYTGYGRIATMGEEVRQPRQIIPRAIILTVGVTLVLYLGVAWAALQAGGNYAGLMTDGTLVDASDPTDLIAQNAPLVAAASEFAFPGLDIIISLGAMTAAASVLLNLLLGLSRVWLAMGRRADMPAGLQKLSGDPPTPVPAVITSGVLVALLALLFQLRDVWTLSAFTVLVYYAFTNLAALKLTGPDRLYPRWIAYLGLTGCLALAAMVPDYIWITGLTLIVTGLIWHGIARGNSKDQNTESGPNNQ